MPTVELIYFKETIIWLLDESNNKELFSYSPLVVFQTFIPEPCQIGGVGIVNLVRKNDSLEVPYLISILAFGNFIFQINIPSLEKDKILFGKKVNISYFPTVFDSSGIYGKPKRKQIDLSSYEYTENIIKPITMHFDSARRTD